MTHRDIRPLRTRIAEFTRNQMIEAILATGSVSKAALILKIHRNTIYNELRREIKGPITTANLRRQKMLKFAQNPRQTF